MATTAQFEVYMRLINRKLLARLIAIKGVSKREVARAAGWKSHTYLLRLLSGEVTTCEVEHAVKIARFLEVGTDDLFMTKVSGSTGQKRASGRTAA